MLDRYIEVPIGNGPNGGTGISKKFEELEVLEEEFEKMFKNKVQTMLLKNEVEKLRGLNEIVEQMK
jgi:hypothetical protein